VEEEKRIEISQTNDVRIICRETCFHSRWPEWSLLPADKNSKQPIGKQSMDSRKCLRREGNSGTKSCAKALSPGNIADGFRKGSAAGR